MFLRHALPVLLAGLIAQTASWPSGFKGQPAVANDWKEHTIDAGSARLRVFLPPQWTLSLVPFSDGAIFSATDLAQAFLLSIDEVSPSSFVFDKPLPKETIQESITAMQDGIGPRGYEVVGGGQVRAGAQLWVWHEARMTSLGAFTNFGPIGSGRTWLFTSTPSGQRLTLRCTALYPRGAGEADLNEKTRQAGSVFTSILERLTVERK